MRGGCARALRAVPGMPPDDALRASWAQSGPLPAHRGRTLHAVSFTRELAAAIILTLGGALFVVGIGMLLPVGYAVLTAGVLLAVAGLGLGWTPAPPESPRAARPPGPTTAVVDPAQMTRP